MGWQPGRQLRWENPARRVEIRIIPRETALAVGGQTRPKGPDSLHKKFIAEVRDVFIDFFGKMLQKLIHLVAFMPDNLIRNG